MNSDAVIPLHIDIVNGCPLSCVGCPTPVRNGKVEWIDPEDFYLCLSSLDVKAIDTFRLFNYGEPLLHPHLTKIGEVLLNVIPTTSYCI
jgi:MoaA/NifB/PqqE/SkfB family radical SAM enzyme